jgi:hypothetical protein
MSLVGKWNLTVDSPIGQQKVTVEVSRQNDVLGGTFTNSQGQTPLASARAEGDQAWFDAAAKTPFGEMQLSFHGTIEVDKIYGQCKTTFGSSPFEGTREK